LQEQKETKVSERKIRDYNAWIINMDESLVEVKNGLDAVNECRFEVEKSKGERNECFSQLFSFLLSPGSSYHCPQYFLDASQHHKHCLTPPTLLNTTHYYSPLRTTSHLFHQHLRVFQ
jgi:hypothetical protein